MNTLRKTRLQNGLSVRAMAAILGFGKSTINDMELNKRPISPKVAIALKKNFNVNVRDIVRDIEMYYKENYIDKILGAD